MEDARRTTASPPPPWAHPYSPPITLVGRDLGESANAAQPRPQSATRAPRLATSSTTMSTHQEEAVMAAPSYSLPLPPPPPPPPPPSSPFRHIQPSLSLSVGPQGAAPAVVLPPAYVPMHARQPPLIADLPLRPRSATPSRRMTAGTAAPALELPLAAGALWSALVHAAARTPTLASHGHLLATIYRGLHSLSECASDYDESLQIPSRRSGPPLPIPINFDAVSVMLVTAEFLSRAGVLSTDHQQWTPILNALLSLSLSRAMWTGQRRLSEQCAVSIAQILHMLRESGHHANAQREMEQFAMAVAQEWASHAPFECTLPTIAAIFEFAHGQEWMPPTPFLRQIVAALPSLANDALYSLTARAATMLLVTPAPLHPDSSASNKDEVARAIVEAVFDPFTARTFAWYSLVDGLRSVALHYLESATEHQPGDPHFGALDLLFSAIVLHSHPQNPSPTALGHHHPSPLAEFDQLRFVHDMLSEARAIHAPRTPILDQPQLLAQWLARQIRAGLSANAAALAVCGMAHVARITGTSVPTLWPTVIVSAHSWAHHPAYLDAVLDALAIVPVSALDSPSLLEALHLVNSTRSAALRQRFAQWMASVFSGDLASPIPNALPEFLRTAHRDFSTAERGLLATAMETQSSDLISSVRRILAPEPAAAPIQSHMLVVVHHPTELLQMSARATTPMPPDHIASDSNIPSSSPLPFDAGEVWRQVVQFNTLGTWAFVELASANLALDTYSPALDVLGVVDGPLSASEFGELSQSSRTNLAVAAKCLVQRGGGRPGLTGLAIHGASIDLDDLPPSPSVERSAMSNLTDAQLYNAIPERE